MNTRYWWLLAALLAGLAAAPNAMVIRVALNEADPFHWIFVRFATGAVIMLPIALLMMRRRHIKRVGKDTVVAGLAMSMALLCYTFAIYYSQASYVSILTMLTPVILILISSRFFKEKITRRKVAGVTLAMMGALVLAVLPFMATGQVTTAIYPLATALGLLNCVMFALAFIYIRKANEGGMPMLSVLGVMALIGVLVTAPLALLFSDMSQLPTDANFYLAAFYSAVGVSILFRAASVAAYERIGAVSIAAVQYIEILAAIVLPVLIINERLSIEMIAGGLMIFAGVYVIESHRRPRTRRRVEPNYQ